MKVEEEKKKMRKRSLIIIKKIKNSTYNHQLVFNIGVKGIFHTWVDLLQKQSNIKVLEIIVN